MNSADLYMGVHASVVYPYFDSFGCTPNGGVDRTSVVLFSGEAHTSFHNGHNKLTFS